MLSDALLWVLTVGFWALTVLATGLLIWAIAVPIIGPLLIGAADWILKTFPALQRIRFLRRFTSKLIIGRNTNSVAPRPHPYSLSGDYTSWAGLVDRSYSGRHLRKLPESRAARPPKEAIIDLFMVKPGKQEFCKTSSFLFAAYAQWFTDSFLRTSHGMKFDKDSGIALTKNGRLLRTDDRFQRNDSNHEIDLNQIYGLNESRTRQLRGLSDTRPTRAHHERGFLGYRNINGEIYPPQLLAKPIQRRPSPIPNEPDGLEQLQFQEGFDGLHDERILREILRRSAPKRSTDLFAVGLEHGNATIGNSVFNTLFLREHNRVAKVIGTAHPQWDDEQVFQTTRNTVMVIGLNTVLSDYIRHISQRHFPIDVIPGYADTQPWYRPNRISIEFNLLYRWHELVPEKLNFLDDPKDYRHNNSLLLENGPEFMIEKLSRQRAGKLTIGNLPERLRPIKADTIDLMRSAQLYTYNAYRERFGLKPAHTFEDITKNPELIAKLKALYPDGVETLEWFVGMYAEDHGKHRIMGELMQTMVANDAFTQALTNPLLANGIYNEKTFSEAGLKEIESSGTLFDLIRRNTDNTIGFECSFSVSPST